MCASCPFFRPTGLQKMCKPCCYVWRTVWGVQKGFKDGLYLPLADFFYQAKRKKDFLYKDINYNYLCSPVRNVLDACISITRGSGRGLGPGIREFFGPCEMASSPFLPLPPPPLSRTYQKSTAICKVHKGTLRCITNFKTYGSGR